MGSNPLATLAGGTSIRAPHLGRLHDRGLCPRPPAPPPPPRSIAPVPLPYAGLQSVRHSLCPRQCPRPQPRRTPSTRPSYASEAVWGCLACGCGRCIADSRGRKAATCWTASGAADGRAASTPITVASLPDSTHCEGIGGARWPGGAMQRCEACDGGRIRIHYVTEPRWPAPPEATPLPTSLPGPPAWPCGPPTGPPPAVSRPAPPEAKPPPIDRRGPLAWPRCPPTVLRPLEVPRKARTVPWH